MNHRRKKRRRKIPDPDSDTEALRGAVLSIITGIGNGGLTMFARKLQITPSNLRKRLTIALNGFDGPTMRAVCLLSEMRASESEEAGSGSRAGDYEVFETTDGPKWRRIDK